KLRKRRFRLHTMLTKVYLLLGDKREPREHRALLLTFHGGHDDLHVCDEPRVLFLKVVLPPEQISEQKGNHILFLKLLQSSKRKIVFLVCLKKCTYLKK